MIRALAFVAALVACGCGAEVAAGGVPMSLPRQKPISRRVEPSEIIPRDLDVVVRIDLARLKEVLGPKPEEEIASRLGGDHNVAEALRHARSMTIALRAAHIEQGDHVLVLEGDMKKLSLEPEGYREETTNNDKLRVLVKAGRAARDGTELIVLMDERAVAFVSPAEADAVMRVLRDGADEARGEPAAEGLISADVRPRRLDPELERKFPSIARIVAQVQRMRGTVQVATEGLAVDLEVVARSEAAAQRVAKFFEALRDGAHPEGASAALRGMEIEPLGATVHVRLRVPAEVVLAALARGG